MFSVVNFQNADKEIRADGRGSSARQPSQQPCWKRGGGMLLCVTGGRGERGVRTAQFSIDRFLGNLEMYWKIFLYYVQFFQLQCNVIEAAESRGRWGGARSTKHHLCMAKRNVCGNNVITNVNRWRYWSSLVLFVFFDYACIFKSHSILLKQCSQTTKNTSHL